ncbi:MAG: sigma-54-dependent Fis family transcriptional regulator [Candidatus Eisenbacteria bacterium]|uniref:Sigma-54-dependent Fis family transcriptional regulator n=1 Tax=Eiseniibacteriota bacterium TaxID=2212470 RepID=A0A849SGU3_UNCEI|nr:sigma-54-dependent Fis family transcriptional regulator [Candidatus Eisenbacteria bacterium]
MPSLLIVDDEPNIRSSLKAALEREGYQVDEAASIAAARDRLREACDFVLLDVWFPGENGLDLLAEIHASAPDTTVIMMSGHATLDTAIQATRLGAFDFLEKPVALERLLVLLKNAQTTRALQVENRRLQEPWMAPLIGDSLAIRSLLEQIALAGPSPARVLIRGEHGTGKELVARALHASSARRAMPFVAVNCSAIPEELFESELFGHERGSFTGATQARRGRFEEAHGGTLLLDEVADLSARAQTKLLRVLQEGELTRVGGSRPIRVDVRVVAATNRDLSAAVELETFREDLYFRLAVIPITVPSLRERIEDVPLLVEHFVAQLTRETGRKPKTFAPGAFDALSHYAFPGNVRELRNLVERLIIMSAGNRIGADEVRAVLPARPSDDAVGGPLNEAVRDFERHHIESTLKAESGNMTRAAARLGLERSHLYKKMRQLGLRGDEEKG